MNKISYKLVTIVFFAINTLYAQSFQEKYSSEMSFKKGGEVTLYADYADIEIKEWNKNKIKVDAVMKVEGVSKEEAQSHLNSWNIHLSAKNGKATIRSKSHTNHSRHFDHDFDFEDFNFEMPELSIESLGVLDSMDFSIPEINFHEVFNDSVFNNIYTHDFNIDSLSGGFDFEKLKENQKYLQEWQEANKDNFVKLQKKAAMIAKKSKLLHKKRVKQSIKRGEHAKMRTERLAEINERRAEKRSELTRKLAEQKKIRTERLAEIEKMRIRKHGKVARKRHEKIKKILKDRNKANVRTKLTVYVPKGTEFNMNVNYSKISTN